MILSELSNDVKTCLQYAADKLPGNLSRIFKAKVVDVLGAGGQRKAERELGWNRKTIRKGQREVENGESQKDNFSARGRKKAEKHLPNLLDDIRDIVEPTSQADPTFRTTQLYTPLTAEEVRRRLIEDKGYSDEELPCIRTIRTKLNDLDYHPQKVAKSKPVKKIAETDAIFEQVHRVNREADETEGVVRLSIDAKAKIKVGSFSRGGKSRQGVTGSDHDFGSKETLTPVGIFLPAYDELFLYFTKGPVTADLIVDALEWLWPTLKERFKPNTLVLNLDNGPENNSHRTQFIKRLVEFAIEYRVTIRLAHYPPYHSKYNPVERVWAVLENHWNGELLNTVEKVLGLARTMKWRGKQPATVELVEKIYEKGVKLSKKAMKAYESTLERLPGLEKWFVDIRPCYALVPS